jgi:hypothetical protein
MNLWQESWPSNFDNLVGIQYDLDWKPSLCNNHRNFCKAPKDHKVWSNNVETQAACLQNFDNCQHAVRHMYEMMFADPQLPSSFKHGEDWPGPQRCNNFARKAVRGFFHDQMSNGAEGSILSEFDLGINFGLCRWGQYVNVLSD